MSEEQPKVTYRELLKDTYEAIEVAQELMKSENESSKIVGLNLFLDLSEQALILAEVLNNDPDNDRNPLARRVRIRNGRMNREPMEPL
jgi:hypothetical protein